MLVPHGSKVQGGTLAFRSKAMKLIKIVLKVNQVILLTLGSIDIGKELLKAAEPK
jgi:hypothetical protein